MPAASLATVLAVRTPEDLENANGAMMQCIDGGSEIAEKLFASCVEKAVEGRVQAAMDRSLLNLFAFRPEGRAKLEVEDLDRARCEMLNAAKEVAGTPPHTPNTRIHFKYVLLRCWVGGVRWRLWW